MDISRGSLGLKLNLALALFLLVLGSATALLIYGGFHDTRESASARSREALEELSIPYLQEIAIRQALVGTFAMEWASELGHRAGQLLEEIDSAGNGPSVDTSRLARTDSGIWYDPSPERVTDLVVPNHRELDPDVVSDIEYSAPLDLILPTLVQAYPGGLVGEAYYPIAVIFIGVNGVGRYHPPIGVHENTPADLDVSDFYDRFGPVANPDRLTNWTTPYPDLVGRGLVITAQTPVYQGDTFRGIFEVDLAIDNLAEEIGSIEPSLGGFAFYVATDGDILQSPGFEVLESELASGENEALAHLIERMSRGESGVERIDLGDEEFFIATAPVVGVGGGLAVAAPVAELTANAAAITDEIDGHANTTMLVVLIWMVGLFVVGLIGASYLNRRVLVRPIEALVTGTRAVAQGDFGTRITVRGNDELATLGHSFNQMTADIQREVQEREAAQQELAALFAAMTDRVVVIDKDGRFLRVPVTGAELPDDPGEMEGRMLQDVNPPAVTEVVMQGIHDALATHKTVTLEVGYDARGERRWLSTAISPLTPTSVVAVVRDITDRVNASQELERQVAERTRELSMLLTVSSNVASTLELRPLLALVIEEVRTIADYRRGAVLTIEGDFFTILDTHGEFAREPITHRLPIVDLDAVSARVMRREPVIVPDVRADTPEAEAYRNATHTLFGTAFDDIRSWLVVPLALKDRVIGFLSLAHSEPGFYSEHQAGLVTAVAAQIAVAIENARLYEQAQQLAAVEERQRLARELHDSVSQALYGIALGARTARTLLDTAPERAKEPTDYVLQLAEAGLAEMRALIFELRPESLQAEGLVVALQKHVAATRARYGIDVEAELSEEPELGLAEKEVFYRIGQEALHNVVKHAHASTVLVRLEGNDGAVRMQVRDDGVGFDAGQNFPGHMGLVSITERAESIGATVSVESAPGAGTTVTLTLQRP